jgi:hypothetical protein
LSYAWGENRSDKQPLPQMPPLEGRLALDLAPVSAPITAALMLLACDGVRL